MADREQGYRRVVLVTDNPISRAMSTIASATGITTTVLDQSTPGEDPQGWIANHGLESADAVVLCDHDAPNALDVLRTALDSGAGYVAMMASRQRAAAVFAELRGEGRPEENLLRLHMPAGLDIGGKSAGEIALSVMAEIVAVAHGRDGAAMRLQ
jgi:xanthine/CO dehydrogenase XdhC/CoxF family maturation factor